MELNKENMKKIRWLIAFSVLLYLGVQNLDVVLKYVKIVWGLLLPFVLGGAVVTEEYAEKINADYYSKDAKSAVEIAKINFKYKI